MPAGHKSRGVKTLAPLCLALAAALAAGGCAARTSGGAGARTYYLVFLRPDPGRRPLAAGEGKRIMAAHMANISRMADDGVLVAAGPMDDKPATISGIFVLNSRTREDAAALAARDPTVAGGRNTADVHAWRGPAGMGDRYFSEKRSNPGFKVVMAAHAFCIVKRGPAWAGEAGGGAHDRFIESLRGAGALAAAGPVADDPQIEGIAIFRSPSIEEARKSMEGDPDVRSGRLAVEYHSWWTADGVLPW